MKTEKQKLISRIPSWGLALLTALLSMVLIIFLASLLDLIPGIDENLVGGFAYISLGVIIATACYFICRHNPISIWYVPILCNTMGIISAIVEPNFWITSMWILFCAGWILSLAGAISGAIAGKRSISRAIPE